MRRINIRKILKNPKLKRELMTQVIIATQAREGIVTTQKQAERAYDNVIGEQMKRPEVVSLKRWRNALMCDELFEEIVASREYIEYLEREVVRVQKLYDEEVAYHNP